MKIRGEYWIEDTGHIEFADGSLGVDVPDHAMLAARAIQGKICDELCIDNFDPEDARGPESFEEHVLTEMADEWGIDPDETNLRAELMNRHPNLVVALDAAKDDPREYAMQELNWIRVHGNAVQTAKFDEEARKRISEGIRDILYEDGGLEEAAEAAGKTVDEICGEFEVYISGLNDQVSFYATLTELDSGERLGAEVPTAEAAQKIADQKLAESDRALEHPYYAAQDQARKQRPMVMSADVAALLYCPPSGDEPSQDKSLSL